MSKVRLYGAYVFGNKVEIQSTLATRATGGGTFKADERILALGCLSRIPAEDAHLSPDAALEAFIAERTAERDALWHRIGILNEQCEQARAMIGKSE